MQEFKTMGELVQKVFNVGGGETWEPTTKLRFVVKAETGLRHLQQLWVVRGTLKTEWRDVPLEQE